MNEGREREGGETGRIEGRVGWRLGIRFVNFSLLTSNPGTQQILGWVGIANSTLTGGQGRQCAALCGPRL